MQCVVPVGGAGIGGREVHRARLCLLQSIIIVVVVVV